MHTLAFAARDQPHRTRNSGCGFDITFVIDATEEERESLLGYDSSGFTVKHEASEESAIRMTTHMIQQELHWGRAAKFVQFTVVRSVCDTVSDPDGGEDIDAVPIRARK